MYEYFTHENLVLQMSTTEVQRDEVACSKGHNQ